MKSSRILRCMGVFLFVLAGCAASPVSSPLPATAAASSTPAAALTPTILGTPTLPQPIPTPPGVLWNLAG